MTLVATVFRRRFLDWARYPAEAALSIAAFYVIFLVLFFGAKAFGGSKVAAGDTLSAIVVGYIVFMLTMQSYQQFGGQIMQESQAGTLEQLALSPYGLTTVLLVDFAAQTILMAIICGVVIVPIMATTGRWLHFDVISVTLLTLLTLAGVVGFGLIMGGLAMVFKRMQAVGGFIGIGFLPLVAAPVDRVPWLKLLPIAHGNLLLRHVLVNGRSAFDEPTEVLILAAVSAGYVLAGVLVFLVLDRRARERALIGQY